MQSNLNSKEMKFRNSVTTTLATFLIRLFIMLLHICFNSADQTIPLWDKKCVLKTAIIQTVLINVAKTGIRCNIFPIKKFFDLFFLKVMHETRFSGYAGDRTHEYEQNAFCLKPIGQCIQELEPLKHWTLQYFTKIKGIFTRSLPVRPSAMSKC